MLLRKEANSQFDELPESVWQVWAPIIVAFNDYGGDQPDKTIHDQFAQTCTAVASGEAIHSLRIIIQKAEGHFISPQFLDRLWSNDIEECLCEEVKRAETNPNVVGALLNTLLAHGSNQARNLATQILQQTEQKQTEAGLEASGALLSHVTPESWPTVWGRIRSENDFGKTLLLRHAVIAATRLALLGVDPLHTAPFADGVSVAVDERCKLRN